MFPRICQWRACPWGVRDPSSVSNVEHASALPKCCFQLCVCGLRPSSTCTVTPSPLTPHPSPLTPHPLLLTPHPSPLTPHPSPLSPLLSPHPSHPNPLSSPLSLHTPPLSPHPSLLTPHPSHPTPFPTPLPSRLSSWCRPRTRPARPAMTSPPVSPSSSGAWRRQSGPASITSREPSPVLTMPSSACCHARTSATSSPNTSCESTTNRWRETRKFRDNSVSMGDLNRITF